MAIILAVGIAVALLMLTGTALYATIHHDMDPPRLVAITQMLTGWGGGIVGVLGAYVGYSFGKRSTLEEWPEKGPSSPK